MGYTVNLSRAVLKDLKKVKSAGLSKKFQDLVEVLKNNPYTNPPPYEKLIGYKPFRYSRRLNIQHRLVYTVDEDLKIVTIWHAWTHYEKM